MSYTIHTIQRINLPKSTSKETLRVMSLLQDGAPFVQARDALLRYYYPALRTFTMSSSSSPTTESYTLIPDSAFAAADQAQKWVLRNEMNTKDFDEFNTFILCQRKNLLQTPYERVGNVLSWLKQWSSQQQGNPLWRHSELRQWMQNMLMDFTLVDAKNKPGAILANPEKHYQKQVQEWAQSNSGIPWDYIWSIHEQAATRAQMYNPDRDTSQDSALKKINHNSLALRKQIEEHAAPGAVFLTHTTLGALRTSRPNWRDATDYSILHNLLTQTEETFDADVWMEWLSFPEKHMQGMGGTSLWSTPRHEAIWVQWQNDAMQAYQEIVQSYYTATPRALIDRSFGISPAGDKILTSKLSTKSPMNLDWLEVLCKLSERFPYLSGAPEMLEVANALLTPEEKEAFKIHNNKIIGHNVIQTLVNIPEDVSNADTPFWLPAWFHFYLAEYMNQHSLALPIPAEVLDEPNCP